jgi:hypothetical protein
MAYNKHDIDSAAEREGIALDKMHRRGKDKRVNIANDYNVEHFEKLFKKTGKKT